MANEVKFKLSIDGTQTVMSAMDRVKGSMAGVSDAAATVGSAMRMVTAALSVGAIAAWAKSTIDAADAMNDLSQKVGIAVKDLAKYELAANQSGTSMDAIAKGIKGLSGNLMEHGDALKKAGIDATTADQAMKQLADVFASMPDGMEKTTLATKMFGKAGMEMIPMLNLGSEGLQTAAEKSAAYAAQMAAMAPLADAFNDSMSELALSSKTIGMSLLNDALPGIVEITKAMADASLKGGVFSGIMAGVAVGFENYKNNVREFWGMKRPTVNTGGADGSWGPSTGGATGDWGNQKAKDGSDAWIAKYKSMMDAIKGDASVQKTLADINREFEAQAKLLAELAGLSGSFEQDWSRLSALYKAGKIDLQGLTAAQAVLLDKQPVIQTEIKAQTDAVNALAKANLAAAESHLKFTDSLSTGLENLKAETLAQQESNDRLGLGKEAIAALDAAKLESQAVTLDLLAIKAMDKNMDEVQYNLYKAQAEELRNLASLKIAGAHKQVGIDAATDMAAAQKRAAEESSKYWEDALMRAFESGKGFFESLWDTIKNTLKTQALQVLIRPVVGTLGGFGGAAAMAGEGGNMLGTAANLGTLYNTLSGGVAALGSTIGNLGATTIANVAGAAGGDAIGTLAALKGAGSANMAAIGSAANYLGAAGVGLFVGGLISGGKSAIGGNSNTAVVGGTAIGALIGGPIGAAIGGAIGGIVNAAFGHGATEVQAQGTRGTLSNAGFAGSNYVNLHQDGGWFSSDNNWTTTSAVDPAMATAWGQAFAGIKLQAAGMASTLGLATDKIIDYTKYVDVAAGTTQEQMTALFTSMADDMARAAAPGIAEFAKTGETASVTLQRLSSSITTTNAWLSMLRNRLFDVSISGADAASKLADTFGGLDNLAASSKAYYDTFYTEAEKTATSTENLAKAMALVGIAMPDTKEAFKDVVKSLDLTTESGRNAYAVMLALAPEFATTSEAIDKAAKDTATKLLAAFSGNGALIPALDATKLSIGDVATGAGIMTTALTYINKIMGDASSGVITLGGNVITLGNGLTDSQVSAGLLSDQIIAIKDAADAARINFTGLGDALANVNTETFVATIALVFENLSSRIQGVISDISTERIAVREAALQIINPTVMSKAQIQAGIDGINVHLPSNTAIVDTNDRVSKATIAEGIAQKLVADSQGLLSNSKSSMQADVAFYQKKVDELYALAATGGYAVNSVALSGGRVDMNNTAGKYNAATNRFADASYGSYNSWAGYYAMKATATERVALYDVINSSDAKLIADEAAISKAAEAAGASIVALAAATTAKTSAETAAKAAILNYASAIQNFTIDAGKSVGKLTKLREETVKYYEAQKQLADLMTTSAANLRTTISNYQYSQLTPEAQLASLQAQFISAYTMANATQLDGATLASYGDKLNGLLGPLIDKLNEVGKGGMIGNYLIQAEAVAAMIDKAIPVNYQADSLDMLGSIDATLAALDESTKSAEQIIADAVTAGADRTAAGLKAIGEAISGKTIPAFATGGSYSGGMALVGEQGPEVINFNRPGQVYNANQTAGMFGSSEAVIAELRALRAEVKDLRAEARSTAVSSNKTAKILERVTPDGSSLQTVAA